MSKTTSCEDKQNKSDKAGYDSQNPTGIYVIKTSRQKAKKQFCPFCGKEQSKLRRHLERFHADEKSMYKFTKSDSIKNQPALTAEQKYIFDLLKSKGNHMHNVKTLRNRNGGIIVQRSPTGEDKAQYTDYMPCPFCFNWVMKGQLGIHETHCDYKTNKQDRSKTIGQTSMLHRSRFLLYKSMHAYSPEMIKLLGSLKNDVVADIVRSDGTILTVGQDLFDKQNRKEEHIPYVRDRMREIGRLLKALREKNGYEEKNMAFFISASQFTYLVETARRIAVDKEKFTLALKTGYNLKKCCESVWTDRLINGDKEGAEDANDFLALYEKNWGKKIASQSVKNLNDRHLNKEYRQVRSEDIVKLSNGLKDDQKKLSRNLKRKFETWTYFEFMKCISTYLSIYNKKRLSEVPKMKIKNYLDAKKAQSSRQTTEEYENLDNFEKAISDKHLLVKLIGKKGRHVPILVPTSVQEGIELLLELRTEAGILETNEYLFAKNDSNTYVPIYAHLMKSARLHQLQEPELLKTTALRKHLATSLQVMALKSNDLQKVADFLGHDKEVHKKYYRMSDDVYSCTRIASLLMATESGRLKDQGDGKTMEELFKSYDPSVDEEEIDDDDEDFNLSNFEDDEASEDPKPSTSGTRIKFTTFETNLIKKYFANHIKENRVPTKNEVNDFREKHHMKFFTWDKIKRKVHGLFRVKKKNQKSENLKDKEKVKENSRKRKKKNQTSENLEDKENVEENSQKRKKNNQKSENLEDKEKVKENKRKREPKIALKESKKSKKAKHSNSKTI